MLSPRCARTAIGAVASYLVLALSAAPLKAQLTLGLAQKGTSEPLEVDVQVVNVGHDPEGWYLSFLGPLPSAMCVLRSADSGTLFDIQQALDMRRMLATRLTVWCMNFERSDDVSPARVNLDDKRPGTAEFLMQWSRD